VMQPLDKKMLHDGVVGIRPGLPHTNGVVNRHHMHS
jgi:hypothetical protein